MRSAGLDIGSRSIELVVVEDGEVAAWHVTDTSHDPAAACRELLSRDGYDSLVVTGYGRGLAEVEFDAPTVTEIKAYAVGARRLFPDCRTVIDIGGQDTKAIGLAESGAVERFEMNDRCSAGTGRFLEVMAQALKYSLDEFSREALDASGSVRINSMCTVFAESEVISLVAKGTARDEIARGLHSTIVDRTVAIAGRVSAGGISANGSSAGGPVVFAGGGALNACLRSMIEERLKSPLSVPDNPQIVGALGAALIAGQRQT